MIAGQFLTEDQASPNPERSPSQLSVPGLTVAGQVDRSITREANLPNGGAIGLTVRRIKQPLGPEQAIGGLLLKNHGVAGYEQVTLIEFIVK